MPARTPEECDHLPLYEADAVIISAERQRIAGHVALREVMAVFAAARPRLAINLTMVDRQGDLTVIYNDWTLSAALPDGTKVEQSGRAVELVRRQADGTWRFAFDDPYARSL